MTGTLAVPTTGTVSGLQMANDINTALAALATANQGGSAPSPSSTGLISTSGVYWHDTVNNLLKLRDQADTTWMTWLDIDETNKLLQPANTVEAPMGRLTLTSGSPIMGADVTAAGTIYYAPGPAGNLAPIPTAAGWFMLPFSQLSLVLDTTGHVAGNLYDIFLYYGSGAIQIGTGPSWATGGGSSSARGTGAGSTALQTTNGLKTNANSIVLRNNSANSGSIPAGQALYIGTFYATANGQTAMQFRPAAAAGGSNAFLGLFNAFNRVRGFSRSEDSNSTYSYTSGTWREADASASNRITWVDGLGVMYAEATYCSHADINPSSTVAIGVWFNATSGTPSGFIGECATGSGTGVNGFLMRGYDTLAPTMGVNFAQAAESGASSASFLAGQQMMLTLNLEV